MATHSGRPRLVQLRQLRESFLFRLRLNCVATLGPAKTDSPMIERSEKVKVFLLDGPFGTQDVYVDQAAIVDKFVLIKGEPYELVEDCNTYSEAYCFRWRGNQ